MLQQFSQSPGALTFVTINSRHTTDFTIKSFKMKQRKYGIVRGRENNGMLRKRMTARAVFPTSTNEKYVSWIAIMNNINNRVGGRAYTAVSV